MQWIPTRKQVPKFILHLSLVFYVLKKKIDHGRRRVAHWIANCISTSSYKKGNVYNQISLNVKVPFPLKLEICGFYVDNMWGTKHILFSVNNYTLAVCRPSFETSLSFLSWAHRLGPHSWAILGWFHRLTCSFHITSCKLKLLGIDY